MYVAYAVFFSLAYDIILEYLETLVMVSSVLARVKYNIQLHPFFLVIIFEDTGIMRNK